MKYILQRVLKTKAKDCGEFESMEEAHRVALARGFKFEGTSYIGMFPQYSFNDNGTVKYYRIVLEHKMGMVCSPSVEELTACGLK